MKKNEKRDVMMMAAEIRRATGKNLSVCLAKAWQINRLMNLLHEGVVRFAYERADGSLRRVAGTLKNREHLLKGNGKKNYKTLCYYDMNAAGFRSFRVENLITIY